MVTKLYGLAVCAALAGCSLSGAPSNEYQPPISSEYQAQTAPATPRAGVAERKHHAVFSERTEAMQRALQDRRYYWGAIDGLYGPQTTQAVKAFQRDLGVPVTGIDDGKTLEALDVH